MNAATAAPVTSCVPGPPITMCPTVETWSVERGQTGAETIPCAHTKIEGSKLQACSPRKLPTTNTVATPSHNSRPKPHGHNGETPCHKDSKCVTCREKPPPNQVCTAVPSGERNELDEALYRCAVGSIFGIRSLTPQLPDRTNGATVQSPNPVAPSRSPPKTGAAGSPVNSPLEGPKSVKNSRENSLSSQRRMAMARKQRQLEAGYLSSSSDSSSDSEEETQRKRRRKVARTSVNSAPPNRICTAVPLLDRTLPLPCLTRDLTLVNYFDGDKPSGGEELLSPSGGHPSGMPSPLSLDRLSSPEPQSSPSEPHEYYSSSTSSSDLSDFEYIPPPQTSRTLSSATVAPAPGYGVAGQSAIGTNVTILNPDYAVGGEATQVTANKAGVNCGPVQNGGSDPPCMQKPPQLVRIRTPSSSCSYPDGGQVQSSQTRHFPRPNGVLSSVPPPFVMQLDPATLSSSDNSDRRKHSGHVSSSASDENRRNQNCEILAESRIVGEMCYSPDSLWSDSGLRSPYFNPASPHFHPASPLFHPASPLFHPASPQTQQTYPRQSRLPSDSDSSSFCAQVAPCKSMRPANGMENNAHPKHGGFAQTAQASHFDANTRHFQPSLPRNDPPVNAQSITCHYPPITHSLGHPAMYDQPMGRLHEFGVNNFGNTVRECLPMRSLERAPTTDTMMVPPLNAGGYPQNGYGPREMHCRGTSHFMTKLPPPNTVCTDMFPQKPMGLMGNQPVPFNRMFGNTY